MIVNWGQNDEKNFLDVKKVEAFFDALNYYPRLLVASEEVTYGAKHDKLSRQESKVLEPRGSLRRNTCTMAV